jgi:trans-2,3-dihydro-3-hydroxyanthranilate isomerase
MKLEYSVVDVFTSRALEGNALAVFHDARGLDGETMQRIARETNLSETTFVLPPSGDDAAPDVRIFTPARELPFAGHPTIGTANVLRAQRIVDPQRTTFALREKIGLVPVRVEDGDPPMIWLRTPPIEFRTTYEAALAAAAASLDASDVLEGVPCRLVTAGNPCIFVAVRDAQTVDRASVDLAAYRALVANETAATCVFVFAPVPDGAYSRMFAPEHGIVEDPATGSATGPLAAFMMRYGLAPSAAGTRFVSEQGTKMGRRSLLHVLVHGEHGSDGIEVGGNVTHVASAVMTLDGSAQPAAAR